MLQEERCKIILETLHQNEFVKVTELVRLLNVSVDTVRRDLELMESKKLLKRVHGGAILAAELGDRATYFLRETKNKEQKKELAQLACQFVSEGQAIALNAGTTNFEIAKSFSENFEKLTIISNSLRIIDLLSSKPKFTVIVPGGILDHDEYALYGKKCEEWIVNYNIDQAFISVNAISLDKGVTDFRIHEIDIINAMISVAREKSIVADSSKFEKISYINVCELAEIDRIVTDSKINDHIAKIYRNAGIEVVH